MKEYVKPAFEIVQLSMEERLATWGCCVSSNCKWPPYPPAKGYKVPYYNPWGGWFYVPWNATKSWWTAFWGYLKWW